MGRLSLVHIINGDTVLQYSKPSMGGGVANRYNPAVWQPGKPLTEGYIALQRKGKNDLISQPVSERIKISSTYYSCFPGPKSRMV